jgi:DNA repair protein RecO (recombination protein O)
MPLVETDAIVLHAFDYSETSRILRLATRDAGVQSVLARGARRGRSKVGTAVDLFAQGAAELHLREGRDLQTLSGFDVTHARPALGDDLGRFTGASAVAEIMLRFGAADEAHPELFDTLAAALDRIALAEPDLAYDPSLASAWQLLGELGFAPQLGACASCGNALDPAAPAVMHAALGGALCAACAAKHPGGRRLPHAEFERLVRWVSGSDGDAPAISSPEIRAHQRLLREFLEYHLSDSRPLRAFAAWETGRWDAA